eukprot:TRINITY_DN3484_c1_g1_i1.p1 TRINITY_DN3484_c1_g1~~TRINITY_DN3484_c1_g1_i1.p1  ORF type:complete len:411 (+),score=41.88 TRINITY_DN3484_c1_g1_i1:127-1359(+)
MYAKRILENRRKDFETLILWSTSSKPRNNRLKAKRFSATENTKGALASKGFTTRAPTPNKTFRARVMSVKRLYKTPEKPGKPIKSTRLIIRDSPKKEEPQKTNDTVKPTEWKPEQHPLSKIDRAKIEELVSKAPRTSLKDLCDHINKRRLSEESRAYLIFRWLTLNVTLDKTADTSPETVFKSGKTSSSLGYAALYQEIASQVGLNAATVQGWTKNVGDNPDEGISFEPKDYWTAACIGGNWFLIDSAKGQGKDYYFCVNPAELIRTHYPKEDKWQLLAKPFSKDAFQTWAVVTDSFFRSGLLRVEPDKWVMKTNSTAQIDIYFDANKKPFFTPHIKLATNKGSLIEIPFSAFVEMGTGGKASVQTAKLKPGTYRLLVGCSMQEFDQGECAVEVVIKCHKQQYYLLCYYK